MRLIDADYLIYAIEHELWDWGTVDGITATTVLKQTISDIKQTPTVDAVPVEDHKILVEKARREAYHSGYKQGRFDEFIEAQYGRVDYDIVPVCRCKDCKWHRKGRNEKESWNQCIVHCRDTTDMNYCAWAERKEDGTL